jgi:hypothetical protein
VGAWRTGGYRSMSSWAGRRNLRGWRRSPPGWRGQPWLVAIEGDAVEATEPSLLRNCVLGTMAFASGQLLEAERRFSEARAQARMMSTA